MTSQQNEIPASQEEYRRGSSAFMPSFSRPSPVTGSQVEALEGSIHRLHRVRETHRSQAEESQSPRSVDQFSARHTHFESSSTGTNATLSSDNSGGWATRFNLKPRKAIVSGDPSFTFYPTTYYLKPEYTTEDESNHQVLPEDILLPFL